MNKIFYDFETSGLSKWYDIPLDGAFILTDENLNKIDEYSFKIALPEGLMPSPIGLLVNKADLSKIYEGDSYYNAMAKLFKKLSSWGPACYIGQNNIKFDEHFMRMGFYKTMQENIYLTNTNGNTRADLLPMLHCVKQFSPNALSFPETEDKEPIFKLDQIAPLNGLDHNAHNSMGDVIVTIELAKIIKDRCPTIWDSALRCNSKSNVKHIAENEPVFCYGSYNFKRQADFGTYTLIGFNSLKGYESEMLVFDLSHDISAFEDATMDDLQKLVRSNDSPFRIIKINESPILLPSSLSFFLDEGLEESDYIENALQINANYNFRTNSILALEKSVRKYTDSTILEKKIYSGQFYGPEDKNLIKEFHERLWEDKYSLKKHFRDPRLSELAVLNLYHEKPEVLSLEDKQVLALSLAKRVTSPSSKEWRTGDDAMREIKKARDKFLYEPAKLDKMENFIHQLIIKHHNIIKENS